MRTIHALAALILAQGCLGTVSDPGAEASTERPTPPHMTVFGSAPMRRLSNVEYERTVTDLFAGFDVSLADLPPDATAAGFENDARSLGPSDVRVARWEENALRFGRAVSDPARIDAFLPCAPSAIDAASQSDCGSELIRDFGARAYRRPLTADEAARYQTLFDSFRTEIDFPAAVQLTVMAFLQSPSFLYRLEMPSDSDPAAGTPVPLTSFEMASRLSYFFWQSMPDQALFAEASADALRTPEQVEAAARRLLEDERARRMTSDFHRQWLEFDRILEPEHENRVPDLYPGWSSGLITAIREEQDRFVESTIFDREGTLGGLLTSRHSFVNASLAEHYGVGGPADDGTWIEVDLPEGERAGFLTRAGFLAAHAHASNGSPPLRGVFVMERILCEPRPSPPPDVDLTPPENPEGEAPRTNRELFEERTAGATCQVCHTRIDGFGYGFEHYDATGAYRATDNGNPVNAAGRLQGTDVDRSYVGAIELSEAFAESSTVHGCATRQWLRFALGRAVEPVDAELTDRLAADFTANGGDIRELLVDIVTSREFMHRAAVQR